MPKPAPRYEYVEGPEALRRFDQVVRQVIGVPASELKKREKAWRKSRAKRARARTKGGV